MAFDQSEEQETRQYDESQSDFQSGTAQPKPAVGLIARPDNAGDLVSAIFRADRAGHQVLVTHPNQPSLEGLEFAKRLDVTIVDPPQRDPDLEDMKRALITVAKAHSFPGLIYDPANGIATDYIYSTARLRDSEQYCLKGIPEQAQQAEVIVGIPAYNEAATIADVVSSAREFVDTVLVIDDGSTDDTASVARDAGATVIERENNKGYGAALKTIFREAEKRHARHLVVLDADGQHDPADIPALIEAQEETDADIVVGSRFAGGGTTNAPLYRLAGLFIVNILTNLSFGVVRPKSWISDTQSGFRAYNWRAIESLADDDELGDQMSASTDILHHAHHYDYDLHEIGTTVDYNVEDANSHHPLSHGISLVSNILKTVERERPIMSLGVPGFTSTLLGIGLGYWAVSNYIASGTFPLGIAITSAFFALAGILACFTAIILHSLRQHLDD